VKKVTTKKEIKPHQIRGFWHLFLGITIGYYEQVSNDSFK